MKIYTGLENFKKPKKSIVSTGTFDGVHKGHVQIIKQLCAKKENEESVLITFSPHPRIVLYPDQDLKLINSIEEKIELFKNYPIDHLIIQNFDFNFSRLSPLEYIRDFLVQRIGLSKLIIGYDHHFGRNRESSLEIIKEYSELFNFEVVTVPKFRQDGVSVSSTKIRNFLEDGKVELVNQLLGYKFSFTGRVVKGKGVGKSIGYPTANLEVDDKHKLIPAIGVFSVYVFIKGVKYFGMLNIGKNPTFGLDHPITVELHILDFSQNIYFEELKLVILSKIRNEIKFESKEKLISQLEKDELRARNYFNNLSSK